MSLYELNAKITMPAVQADMLCRKKLLSAKENEIIRLTILCAPAGYGKTTLLSQWFEKINECTAWLTLDSMDNDPIRFWTFLIESITNSGKQIQTDGLLAFLQTCPASEMLVDMLSNELGQTPDQLNIILEEYHLIDNPSIHKMIGRLINYLPHNIKLFISSRSELPLTVVKWRTKGWVREIGVEELQFHIEEVKEFYEKQNVTLQHPSRFYEQIRKQTEGWPAGIQLITLAGIKEQRTWDSEDGSVHYPVVTNYLVHEILATLPPDIQDFLLRTSLLNTLEPSICNILTDRANSEEILFELERKGLFVSKMYGSQPIFRYHLLFSEALQAELQHRFSAELIIKIYRETAHILYENQEYCPAIELALQGRLYGQADKWICMHLMEIISNKLVTTFMRWIQIMRKHHYEVCAETLVLLTLLLVIEYELDKAEELIRELDRRDRQTNWKQQQKFKGIAFILDMTKVFFAFARGEKIKPNIFLVEKNLEENEWQLSTRWDKFPIFYNHREPLLLRTSLGARGRLCSVEDISLCTDILLQENYKGFNFTGYSLGVQAEILYERNLLDAAYTHAEKALPFAEQYNDAGLYIPMTILQAKICTAKKQFVKAQALLDYTIEKEAKRNWQYSLWAMKGLVYLREEDVEKAESELKHLSIVTSYEQTESGLVFWKLIQIRLLIEKKELTKALHQIDQVILEANAEKQLGTLLEAGVLRASCLWNINRKNEAAAELHEILVFAMKYGYMRTVMDESSIQPVLNAYITARLHGGHPSWESVPLVYAESLRLEKKEDRPSVNMEHTLSLREQEILKVLVTGASNKEIAQQLFLSEGTVRVYLSKIYKKLRITSRTQAIVLAKDWQETY